MIQYSTLAADCCDPTENNSDDLQWLNDLHVPEERTDGWDKNLHLELLDDLDQIALDDATVTVALSDRLDWSKKVTEPTPKPLSKKVTRRFRISDARDKEAIKKTQQKELAADRSGYPLLVGDFHTTISTPSKPLAVPTSKPKAANDNPLPAWVFTGPRAKLWAANRALYGSAWAFSLNLSPDQCAAALASPKGFTDYMRRAMHHSLKRRLGYVPPFWFMPDVDADGRFHLHGGISCNLNIYESEVAALCEAGGKWASDDGKEYQLDLKPQYDADGWVTYALGNWPKVKRLLPDEAGAITKRGRVRKFYDALRADSGK